MYSAYEGFASVYDQMQYNIDYDFWVEAFKEIIKRHMPTARQGLELGCGTGTIAIGMSKLGFVMEGLDLSSEMLMIAEHKAQAQNAKIKFYNQDIRDMALKKTYDFILAPCDAFNYLESEDLLESVFKKVSDSLAKDGLFIFDLSSEYKFQEVLGDQTIAETFEDSAFIWENQYDPELKKLSFYLTLFLNEDSSYQRVEEYHEQYAYDENTVVRLLEAYFEVLEIRDGDAFSGLKETSERHLYICKKKEDNHE